jgi:tetratricopeptide (TPR) repeat protein
MRSLIVLSFEALMLAVIAVPASAQTDEQIAQCKGVPPTAEGADAKVLACAAIIQTNPKDHLAYISRGEAYFTQGRYDLAMADYDRAMQLEPLDAKSPVPDYGRAAIYNDRGMVEYELHNYDSSINDFNEAIKLDPDDQKRGYYNRAVVYGALHQYIKAISDYNEAIDKNPKFALAYNNRGDIYGKTKQYDRAAADFDQVLFLDPQLDGNYGFILAYDGQDFSPRIAAPLYRGLADAQGMDFKGAVTNFLDARKVAPDAPQIWLDLGLAESHLDGWELRSIASFQLYLLKVPQASNASAVEQEIGDLEDRYELRLKTVFDRLESILAVRKAEHQARQYSPQPQLRLSAAGVREAVEDVDMWVGWDLAGGRLAVGDIPGAMAGLRRTNGSQWRQDWDKAWRESMNRHETAGSSEEPLVVSIAAAGLLDQANDMLRGTNDPDAIDFFLERGDTIRAQRLAGNVPDNRIAKSCSPDDLAQIRADGMRYTSRGGCGDDLWWSTGREPFLVKTAVIGIGLNTQFDETQMADYLRSNLADPQFDGLSSVTNRMEYLALVYRKVRGPARENSRH